MTTYKLKTPVEVNGKVVSELTFRKLKAKDLAAADLVEGQVKKGFAILASMAGSSLPVIMELELEDLEGAQEAAAPFMGNGHAATEKAATEPA